MVAEQSENRDGSGRFSIPAVQTTAALIGYLPTGYPDVPASVAAMTALDSDPVRYRSRGLCWTQWTAPPSPGQPGGARGGCRVRDTLAAVEAIPVSPAACGSDDFGIGVGFDAFAQRLAAAGARPEHSDDEAQQWLAASEEHRLSHFLGRAVLDTGAVGVPSARGLPRPGSSTRRRCRGAGCGVAGAGEVGRVKAVSDFRWASVWVCGRALKPRRSPFVADGVIVGSTGDGAEGYTCGH